MNLEHKAGIVSGAGRGIGRSVALLLATEGASVSFWLFGGSYGLSGKELCSAAATEYGWICSWNTTGVPNGSYALYSVASGAGGSGHSAGVSITVKN